VDDRESTEPNDIDPANNAGWFPLIESTGRVAQLIWVERQLGFVLDAWSRSEAHAQSCLMFARNAEHHRWHAEILEGCLPTTPELAAHAAIRPPNDAWESAVAALRSLDGSDRSLVRLLALVREIDPWLSRETGALLALLRPIADGALIRWLRFVVIDHEAHATEGEALLAVLQADQVVQLADRRLIAAINLTSRATTSGSPD